METTKKLIMVFDLDNGDKVKYSLNDPKDALTKAETDAVMQKMIDANAVTVKGHAATAISSAYIYTTTQSELA